MMTIRSAAERGISQQEGIFRRHSFSFGPYYDAKRMGFGPLRVLNEEQLAAGVGFAPHAHADVEILTLVLEGCLRLSDAEGNGIRDVRAGGLHKASAGTGLVHVEANASAEQPLRYVQAWLLPDRRGLEPCEELVYPPAEQRLGCLQPVGGPRPGRGRVTLRQDAWLYLLDFDEAHCGPVLHEPECGRCTWVQMLDGAIEVNGRLVCAGDGVAIVGEPALRLDGKGPARLMLFDLPPA